MRTPKGWVHGAHVGAWRGLCVPGARDVTLEELHGHRVIRAAEIASRREWVWTPYPNPLYVPVGDARRFGELAWSRTGYELRDPVHGLVSGFPAKEWERRRTNVIGLWAPELVHMDCRGSVAAAGLDERAADRDARMAAGYRRALVHRGAREFGLSRETARRGDPGQPRAHRPDPQRDREQRVGVRSRGEEPRRVVASARAGRHRTSRGHRAPSRGAARPRATRHAGERRGRQPGTDCHLHRRDARSRPTTCCTLRTRTGASATPEAVRPRCRSSAARLLPTGSCFPAPRTRPRACSTATWTASWSHEGG